MGKVQRLVSTDGVSIDVVETVRQAKKKVAQESIPIHVCGKQGQRECPCWECTSKSCVVCMADMF